VQQVAIHEPSQRIKRSGRGVDSHGTFDYRNRLAAGQFGFLGAVATLP
jgi:hypothetical protein